MKRKAWIAILMYIIFASQPNLISAQESQPFQSSVMIGADVSLLFPFGDITANGKGFSGSEATAGIGIHSDYRLLPFLGFQASFLFGKLHGDREGRSPDYSFDSSIAEGTIKACFHLNQLIAPNAPINSKGGIYVYSGAGFVTYKAELFEGNQTISNSKGTSLVIPFGAGVEFAVSSRAKLYFESGFRYVSDDNFDGYEGYEAKDMYSVSSLGVRIGF
jgi:opacity protein-like surface antigen